MISEPHTHSADEEPTVPAAGYRRALLGASIGTSLEWFDFFLYGALAGIVFPHVFFPESSPSAALLQSFATFGVGFLARPVGAAAFSRLADRVGRKHTMVVTLIMMGTASLGIACLPGYAVIGVAAPTLLVLLRFLQGFSVGGEASAGQIMAMEFAPSNRRGLYGALVNIGNPVGQVLVGSMMLLVGVTIGEHALNEWAWRLPFVAGAAMAIVGYWIRRQLNESPAFIEAKRIGAETASPLRTVLARDWRRVVTLVLIWAPNTACSYVIVTYSLSYITDQLNMSSTVTFGLLLVLNVIGMAVLPLGGILSDRFGRKPVLGVCLTTSMIGVILLFPLLDTKSLPLMFLAMLIAQGAQLTACGVMPALFAEPFPTSIRYAGHASVYTLNNLLAGGTAPFVAAGLFTLTGANWALVILVVAMYVLSLILLRFIPETRWRPFRSNHSVDGKVARKAKGEVVRDADAQSLIPEQM
ncbi:MFS transporter [Gordonia sp. DT30]|uniref:MFS transporter n=1 Tax=unclassified Gordonia (in: high G+C Gram-positive bacteria) TaxID=2657482 RepID=UPI003CF63E95